MSELLANPWFWALVGLGTLLSWAYTWLHLRGRDWRDPLGFTLGAVVMAIFASGFALFGWRGFAVMFAISVLGWLGTPLAAAVARRRS
jgi:hypothetical protein